MNKIDLDYQNLVRDILENGNKRNDRTGTGTISVFGRQIRFNFKDGKFPLLTTKKMAFKTMVTELLWFLRGDTNIKYLVNNGCHIWDGDCYHSYLKKTNHEIELNSAMKKHPHYGLSQEEFINKIKTDDEFAKKFGELGPVYGAGWRRWKTYELSNHDSYISRNGMMNYRKHKYDVEIKYIDQIANVINLLKTDPDSRRMIVNAWNVGELDQMVLPPCHMMFQFYTRELSLEERHQISLSRIGHDGIADMDSISWHETYNKTRIPTRAISLRWDQRSNDIGLGSPINISSYSLLLMIIAKQVNMVPEEVIGHLGDCHIYNNHVDGLKEQLTRVPHELPTVKISDKVVNDISEYTVNDFTLENYVSHPKIYLPLSN